MSNTSILYPRCINSDEDTSFTASDLHKDYPEKITKSVEAYRLKNGLTRKETTKDNANED